MLFIALLSGEICYVTFFLGIPYFVMFSSFIVHPLFGLHHILLCTVNWESPAYYLMCYTYRVVQKKSRTLHNYKSAYTL